VEAVGDPIALISFLHSLENLPYLMNPISLILDHGVEGVKLVGPTALAPILSRPEEEGKQAAVRQSLLKADFFLTVRAEENK